MPETLFTPVVSGRWSVRDLTYLVGANGSGKSNFLDVLQRVRDALACSLDNALNERGGLNEVRRRSRGIRFAPPGVRRAGQQGRRGLVHRRC